MPKARDRSEERADRLDERGLALDRFCVAQAQANIVGHEHRQRRDILGVEAATPRSPSATWAPIAPSTFRSSACAHTAPNLPALAPMTATGLFCIAFVATGRHTQSSAF